MVPFYIGSDKVFVITELPVLLRNPNIDAITRDKLLSKVRERPALSDQFWIRCRVVAAGSERTRCSVNPNSIKADKLNGARIARLV